MTKQRAVILEIIRSDRCHHTADEIFRMARERLPGISLATVYNNLKALEEERVIRRITGEHSSDRYDGAYEPHGHMVCIRCDRVWDIHLDGMEELLASCVGTEYDSYELKVRCVCDECSGVS